MELSSRRRRTRPTGAVTWLAPNPLVRPLGRRIGHDQPGVLLGDPRRGVQPHLRVASPGDRLLDRPPQPGLAEEQVRLVIPLVLARRDLVAMRDVMPEEAEPEEPPFQVGQVARYERALLAVLRQLRYRARRPRIARLEQLREKAREFECAALPK